MPFPCPSTGGMGTVLAKAHRRGRVRAGTQAAPSSLEGTDPLHAALLFAMTTDEDPRRGHAKACPEREMPRRHAARTNSSRKRHPPPHPLPPLAGQALRLATAFAMQSLAERGWSNPRRRGAFGPPPPLRPLPSPGLTTSRRRPNSPGEGPGACPRNEGGGSKAMVLSYQPACRHSHRANGRSAHLRPPPASTSTQRCCGSKRLTKTL